MSRENKKCGKCNGLKSINDFTKDKQTKDGFSFYCRECTHKKTKIYYERNHKELQEKKKEDREKHPEKRKKYEKEYYKKHPEKKLERGHRYYLTHRKEHSEKTIRYQKEHPEKVKAWRRKYYARRKIKDPLFGKKYSLKAKYGVTLNEYNQIGERQGWVCAICRHPGKRLVVDHNHITKKVRGLLCGNCNIMLGMAKADSGEAFLRTVIEYIKASNKGPDEVEPDDLESAEGGE